MALIGINDFLNSLALYMITATQAQTPPVYIQYTGEPRGMWINKILWPDQSDSNSLQPSDPCSVLRIYGGMPNQNDEQRRAAIQCMTTTASSNEAAAMQQAEALYETLLNPTSGQLQLRPIRELTITNYLYAPASGTNGSWRIVSIDIHQPPGKVGLDEKGRPLIVFNFDAAFVPVGQT